MQVVPVVELFDAPALEPVKAPAAPLPTQYALRIPTVPTLHDADAEMRELVELLAVVELVEAIQQRRFR